MATKRERTIGGAVAAAAAFLCLCGLCGLCGCVQQYVQVDKVIMPTFDHGFIESIAVVEFANRSSNYHAGRAVADRIEGLLVNESPYKVVPRQVLEERGLARGSRVDSRATEQIGRVAGVDAIVLGTVEVYDYEEVKLKTGLGDLLVHGSRGPRVARKASVVFYMKVVNTGTGQVVWSRSASGNVSWAGWKDRTSPTPDTKFVEEALDKALAEVRSVFPHKEKVREPAM